MLDVYRELHSANTELLSTAAARTTAHKALQSHLRQVGDLIEQAAAEKGSFFVIRRGN